MAKGPLATEHDERVVRLPLRPRPPKPAPPRSILIDLAIIVVLGLACLWFYAAMNPPPAPLFATPIPADGASPS